uniref:Uncharacterized protein n=1 Tax=Rhizophora mucronata TaxID=61149 RepID=A0A2P2QPK7_RHIMU
MPHFSSHGSYCEVTHGLQICSSTRLLKTMNKHTIPKQNKFNNNTPHNFRKMNLFSPNKM